MQNKKLFIPGPVDVSPDVREQMSKPMIGHRGSEYSDLLVSCTRNLRRLMHIDTNSDTDVFISPSSATGLMEAAIRNCVKKKCLNIGNGAFSDRWHQITKANGKDADLLELKWGSAVTPDIVDDALSAGDYDAVTVVHNETSTGVTSPIHKIADVVRDYDVSFLVDTVSSMGGMLCIGKSVLA